MYELTNSFLTARFDANGALCALIPVGGENLIAEPEPDLFRMVFEQGACKETLVSGARQTLAVIQNEAQLTFVAEGLTAYTGVQENIPLAVRVELTVRLAEDRLLFSVAVENHSDARMLEMTYPVVGKVRSLGTTAPALLVPTQSGARYQNIGKMLGAQETSRENGTNSMSWDYPGGMSMQWLALTDDRHTLFLTAHDADFHTTEFRVSSLPQDDGAVTMTVDCMACVRAGKSWRSDETELAFYPGDWHRGVRAYAQWIKPYRPAHKKPDWIRRMTGYFLVINKQQFGYEMWKYDTLPALYQMAQAHGCDTVGLFGWYHSGHDNQYPDLEVSPTLGGAEALKENIRAVQQAGGHVTLYYQGHLIDETSPFCRCGNGREVSAKNIWGSSYVNFYNKSHRSALLRDFSNKMFLIACPSSPEWQQLMLQKEDWLAGFGPDGVLYDQIGGCNPYVCFDEGHPHEKDNPAMAFTGGRQKLLGALQTHAKEIGSDFAFFSEHITDLYSAYLDAVHGISTQPGAEDAFRQMKEAPEQPQSLRFSSLFRYAFPETVITVRNPNPFISPRLANYAAVYGFRLEMELRYQTDKDEILADSYAAWRDYARQVSELRKKYADTLLLGEFRDRDELTESDPAVQTGCFVSGNRMSVVLFNDNKTDAALDDLTAAAGWRLCGCDTPSGTLEQVPQLLPAGQLLVLNYVR